ncbi:putative ribosomal protein L18 [Dioscorea sansibarensis]
MIPSVGNQQEKFDIELMDPDLWRVSFGLAHSSERIVVIGEDCCSSVGDDDGSGDCPTVMDNCPDFDEIDDLRLRKKLFYKLDRSSREFEEYSFDFHRKIPSSKHQEKSKQTSARKEGEKSEKQSLKASQVNKLVNAEKKKASFQDGKKPPFKMERNTSESSGVGDKAKFIEGKKLRTPTFNQLTDPYHLPFCLDIFVTKGSVRACVVHRATSKVVVVAHSISKDMKFDVASRKGVKACFAVGKILAQRAMEEDIYNVVYTPRKGDKIEGKLQIVLQSIIDSGIDVNLKLKQKKPSKASQTVSR